MKTRPPKAAGHLRTAAREVSLRIDEVAFGGDGVGRVDGKVWFVPLTLPGEIVRARAARERKDFVKAELVAVDVPSPHRVEAPCPAFGMCGGCRYQHIAYLEQLRIKHSQVESVLQRVGKLPNVLVHPMIGMEEPWNYRNRITVHIKDGRAGFHRLDGNGLVEISNCLLASHTVNQKLEQFRRKRLFDGHRTLREADTAALGFRQTNDSIAARLLDFVCSNLPAGKLFLDVFGGSGFFAKALRKRFEHVIGIDWSEPAIQSAMADAGANEIYFQEDAAEGLRKAWVWAEEQQLAGEAGVVAVVDPPSTGLEPEVITEIQKWKWQQWIYVSCNPATFARDVARLSSEYELAFVQPFDMFPQTAEIEIAGVLRARHAGAGNQ